MVHSAGPIPNSAKLIPPPTAALLMPNCSILHSISLQATTRRQIKRDYEQLGVAEARAAQAGAVHISGGAYIFAAAEQEILEQLQAEVFPDFRQSPQFKSLMDSGALEKYFRQEGLRQQSARQSPTPQAHTHSSPTTAKQDI